MQLTLDGAVAARGGPSDAAAQGTDTDIPSLELLVATGEVQIVEDGRASIAHECPSEQSDGDMGSQHGEVPSESFPEHAPPDDAIGQQRGDHAPVEAVDDHRDLSGPDGHDESLTSWPVSDNLPDLVDAPAAAQKGKGNSIIYKFTEEPINVQLAMAVAAWPICVVLMVGGQSWREIIHIFIRRARDVVNGIGKITSAWWGTEGVGWPTRRYSGIRGKRPAGLPAQEREAPDGFCCLSVFALCRPLRYILRCGCDLTEIDFKMSHIQQQIRRYTAAKATKKIPVTIDIFENKDERKQEIAASQWGLQQKPEERADRSKKAITAITYNAAVPPGMPQFMYKFAKEQVAIRKDTDAEHPQILKELAGCRDPSATLQYRVNERGERQDVDLMEKIGMQRQLKPCSLDHDGITGPKVWVMVIPELKKYGIIAAEKKVPSNFAELLQILQTEMPDIEWPSELGETNAVELAEVQNDPLARALYSLTCKYVDHEAFARVVTRELDGSFAIEDDSKENLVIQWFNPSSLVWVRAGGGRRLNQVVIDICRA